jgi:uncharacterized membrane protein YheB (UPF0754 family)
MKIIIPILVGSIIGYITNWLAIKMLFRPRREIRIFGWRLPFTPGLIPKEKDRIAKSVGEAVGTYLLSPETFSAALLNDKVNQRTELWVRDTICKLNESHTPAKMLLEEVLGIDTSVLLDDVEERLTDFIYSQLREQKFKDELMKLIDSKIYNEYGTHFYNLIKEKADELIYTFSTSERVEEELKLSIDKVMKKMEEDTRTLEEIVPETLVCLVQEYINENGSEITAGIKKMFDNPLVKRKLRGSISELISQNTNKLITVFVSPESIAEKVLGAIEKYIENPSNEESIVSIILALTDKLAQSKVSDIISGISDEKKEQSIEQISQSIMNYISDKDNQKTLIRIAEDKLGVLKPQIKEGVFSLISEKLDSITDSPHLYENLLLIVRDIIANTMDKPLSLIIGTFNETAIGNIIGFIEGAFTSFVKNRMPEIIKQLNLSQVIEEEISGFDVAYTENIIIEIAHKELKAITWLGALLGGIMGILTPLLQLLYR